MSNLFLADLLFVLVMGRPIAGIGGFFVVLGLTGAVIKMRQLNRLHWQAVKDAHTGDC